MNPDATGWARWSGELLWPQELPLAEHLDCRALVSLGVWAHALLAQRPGLTLVGCDPRILRQLADAGVSFRQAPASLAAGVGVGAEERAALFGDMSEDTPPALDRS